MENGLMISLTHDQVEKLLSEGSANVLFNNCPKRLGDYIGSNVLVCETGKVGVVAVAELQNTTYIYAGLDDKGRRHLYNVAGLKFGLSCRQLFDCLFSRRNHAAWAWSLNVRKLFDPPLPAREFGIDRAPRSWCYVGEKDNEKDI